MTVEKWSRIWLHDVIKTTVKVRTYENYKCSCNNHIIPNFGKEKLNKLQSLRIQQYLNQLCNSHATNTVITIRNHFIIMLNSAVEHGYIKTNVAKRTKPPRRDKPATTALTDDQIKKLLEVVEDGAYIFYGAKQIWKENEGMIYLRHCYYAAVLLAITSGMRMGEIFGLQWENVNLEQNLVKVINNMVTSSEKGEFLDVPKTATSKRNILLPQKTVEVLKYWREFQSKYEKKWKGIFQNKKDLVFTNSFGKFVSTSNFNSRYFRKMLKTSGLDDCISFHSLRHSHATQLLKNGVNVKIVSERLGHSATSVTMDIYAHALPDMQEGAVQELNKIY